MKQIIKMNKSYLYIIFALVLVLGVGIVKGVSCNNTFISDNCTISADVQVNLSSGSYYNNGSVGIRFIGSNAKLLCNNSIIYTNLSGSTTGLTFSLNGNNTVSGCTFIGYNTAINWAKNIGGNVSNNVFLNFSTYAIYGDRMNNTLVYNNTFINSNYTCGADVYNLRCNTTGTAIYIELSDGYGNNTIFYNNIYNVSKGVYSHGLSTNNISYNYINNIGANGYAIQLDYSGSVPTNNTIIDHNTIVNGGWDCIAFYGFNNSITNNNISGCIHHILDTVKDATQENTTYGANNTIAYNILQDEVFDDPSYYFKPTCMLITQSTDNNIYNNTCLNSTISLGSDKSSNEGKNNFYNNNVKCYNSNVLNDINCLSMGLNSNVSNNIFTVEDVKNDSYSISTSSQVRVSGSIYSNGINYLSNNNFTGNSKDIFFYFENKNVTTNIINNFMNNMNVSLSGTYKIEFRYASTTNASINTINKMINISSNSPYQDVKDLLTGNFRYANVQNFTVGSGDNLQVLDGSCDTVPTEDLLIGSSITLCSGTYYLADANTNGVLRINSANAVVSCNGTILVGSNITNSRSIDGNFNNGYSVIGCNISNYYWNIYSSSTNNVNISNNNFGHAKQYGLLALNNRNMTIYGNNFLNTINTATYLESTPYNSSRSNYNVLNNYFSNQVIAIKLEGTGNSVINNNTIINSTINGITFVATNFSNVTNNIILNTNDTALEIYSDLNFYNIISNNFIDTSIGHNCLDIQGRFNNFTGNYLNNCSHAAINSNSDYTDKIYSNNNYVANNIINNSGFCIYINSLSNSIIINNTCYSNGLLSNTNSSIGIGVNGYFNTTTNIFTSVNNTLINNTFYNYNLGIYEDSLNSSNAYINNVFISSIEMVNIQSFLASNGNIPIIYFKNNKQQNTVNTYNFTYNKNKNLLVEDYSLLGSIYYMPFNSFLNKTYNGFFNSSYTNTTISIFNQASQYPFNDVFNVSNGVVLASNVDNYTVTLSSGQKISVGYFSFPFFTFNIPPSPTGTLTSGAIILNGTLTDPKGVIRNVTIVLTNILGQRQVYVSNSSNIHVGYSLLGSTYGYMATVYDILGNAYPTTIYNFVVNGDYGTSTCNATEHNIWWLIPLIIIMGFLAYVVVVMIPSGGFLDVAKVIILVVALAIAVNLISLLHLTC